MNSFERWEDGADGTLDRLSSQWSGKSLFKPDLDKSYISKSSGMAAAPARESVPELKVEGDQSEFTLTRLSGQWSTGIESVCDDRDEDAAPYLLVNWKVWCLKVSVLVLIPAFLVLGGGIKHISDFCPTLAEYCHSQTLTIRETLFGKNDLGAAQSHHSLAVLYHKRHEEKRALDHADYAAKIYVLDLLQRMSNQIVTYKDPQVIALEDNLALAAEAADQLGYHTLASKYWRQVSVLQPASSSGLSLDRAKVLLKERYQASNSLALAGQKSDAVMALEGGFALLPRDWVGAIHKGFVGSKVSEDDIESYRIAIDLHRRMARVYLRFNDRANFEKHLALAAALRNHLFSYLAVGELKPQWKPMTSYMERMKPTLAVISIDNGGSIGSVMTLGGNQGAEGASIDNNIRRAVFDGLQGKLSWKLSDDDLNSMKASDFELEPAALRLVFTGKKVVMDPSMSAEKIDSPYMKPHLNQEPDFTQFKEAVLKVSRSL